MTLAAHMAGGASTVCRLWKLTRRDGLVLGFSDHDQDLRIEGQLYRAATGLTAGALQLSTGLAVDNAEAMGALQSEAVTEADLAAGRYDGAELEAWLVNWAEPAQRELLFRGQIGEITREAGAFRAELRGLADLLNQPSGRVFTRDCAAVLGDGQCRFDLGTMGYHAKVEIAQVSGDGRIFGFAGLGGFQPRWFEGGRFAVQSGIASGLAAMVKSDRLAGDLRLIELWQSLGALPEVGDSVTLYAGCDKRAETCRLKFANFENFRGFPHLPSRDFLMRVPK